MSDTLNSSLTQLRSVQWSLSKLARETTNDPEYIYKPDPIETDKYKPIDHFKITVDFFQGKESSNTISDKDFKVICSVVKDIPLSKLTPHVMKNHVLKPLAMGKYYEHIPLILKLLGKTPPTLTIDTEKSLCRDFIFCEKVYLRHQIELMPSRPQFIHYRFVLYKLMERMMEGLSGVSKSVLNWIIHDTEATKLTICEEIWRRCCEELGWVYIETRVEPEPDNGALTARRIEEGGYVKEPSPVQVMRGYIESIKKSLDVLNNLPPSTFKFMKLMKRDQSAAVNALKWTTDEERDARIRLVRDKLSSGGSVISSCLQFNLVDVLRAIRELVDPDVFVDIIINGDNYMNLGLSFVAMCAVNNSIDVFREIIGGATGGSKLTQSRFMNSACAWDVWGKPAILYCCGDSVSPKFLTEVIKFFRKKDMPRLKAAIDSSVDVRMFIAKHGIKVKGWEDPLEEVLIGKRRRQEV